ncbi:TetR/AcrR family transcriptional regulator [Frondihabitans sucicola]|uniref:TetR/AcrR family transcriptional regulator n=1 Tax=Frondihabitans sucicola TaxID=1268041 RepID=UPI0025746151|nr:TetR/AcrR family transcriptional regulator [Frondihabitans sucicola]
MPTPDRTSLDAIVLAARDLLETEGLSGMTMNAVAARVGVRAPSLYKRVESREKLIQLVAEATMTEFASRLDGATTVAELANGFRDFGHERPAAFQLVMTPAPGVPSIRLEFAIRATEAVLRVTSALAGPEHGLEAARTLTAWVAGFVSMELSGSFKLGGDVQSAWDFGLAAITAAIRSRPTTTDAPAA